MDATAGRSESQEILNANVVCVRVEDNGPVLCLKAVFLAS